MTEALFLRLASIEASIGVIGVRTEDARRQLENEHTNKTVTQSMPGESPESPATGMPRLEELLHYANTVDAKASSLVEQVHSVLNIVS